MTPPAKPLHWMIALHLHAQRRAAGLPMHSLAPCATCGTPTSGRAIVGMTTTPPDNLYCEDEARCHRCTRTRVLTVLRARQANPDIFPHVREAEAKDLHALEAM